MISTETVYVSLFSLLSGCYPWAYKSRHILLWDNVNMGQQPAMFLREMGEDVAKGGGLYRRTLRAQIWIYAQAPPNPDEEGNYPSQVINPILDAVWTAIMSPIPGEKQTLAAQNSGAPLVENVEIDGKIILDDPVAPDQQIVIVIPLAISTGI